jgi:hypothetical protein
MDQTTTRTHSTSKFPSPKYQIDGCSADSFAANLFFCVFLYLTVLYAEHFFITLLCRQYVLVEGVNPLRSDFYQQCQGYVKKDGTHDF